MELKFIKLSPTQNMTILVESFVERGVQAKTAARLMDYSNVYAEQVGYIEKPENMKAKARLQMMGGEFCGNATMSLAVYLAWSEKLPEGGEVVIPLEVSGAKDLLECVVRNERSGFSGKVSMPVPDKIEDAVLEHGGGKYNVTIVYMPGITHIVLPENQVKGDKVAFAESAACEWVKCITEDAFGILLYDETDCRITPLVHVKNHSSVWERGCGSGSASVGAAIAYKNKKDVKVGVKQPGGTITVEAKYENGKITYTCIEGKVDVVATGTAYIK